jgi:transcriptional regulator
MYIPAHFAETRIEVLHQLILEHPLGTLVTMEHDGLNANHLPFLLIAPSPEAPLGTLQAHIARGNSLWKNVNPDVEALVAFQGPGAYITPSWYEEKELSGEVVPTYNYAVVHGHGTLRLIHDAQWLLTHLYALTNGQEADRSQPWKVSDAPAAYIDKLIRGLVGIEIPLSRLSGKWKVSQNKSAVDRANVTAGLQATGNPQLAAMAALVEKAAKTNQ